jgi:hypothetical protein
VSLCDELEAYRDQMEGVPFDIPSGDYEAPPCLGNSRRKFTVISCAGIRYPGKGLVWDE